MPTRVDTSDFFDDNLRRLARKYPRVLDEVERLIDVLESDERPGDKIPRVKRDVYKVRLKNPSAGKGKRGGFRVVYYVKVHDHIYLLTIYSKTDQTDISPEEIRRIIDLIDST